ncbi:MAG: enoyl-CoA hydratase/isomerase family protein [Planctomycetota bacterium JB042]
MSDDAATPEPTPEPPRRPEPVPEPEPEEEEAPILYQVDSPAAIVTLNRPSRRNAINVDLIDGIHAALDRALDDDSVRAVILTGAGPAFCSGLDLHDAAALAEQSYEEQLANADQLARLFRRLSTFEKVSIAAVNGPALASGCGLAVLCDFTLATGQARFGFPEVKFGFVPAVVAVYMRGMVGEKRLRDLLLTGRSLSADEAHEIGLVSSVVPSDDLLEQGKSIARTIARNAPLSIQMTKELLETLPGLEIDRALKAAVEVNARMRGAEECREGVSSFLEGRDPAFVARREDEDAGEAPAGSP